MSNEAARLVDELTTLLYTPFGTHRGCPQVACGACYKQADRPESVVHKSDCPVYRLTRAEEANTAVIRANAEEIADLEDKRDDLEAKVNALTAQMECRNELTARIRVLEAERDDWRDRADQYLDTMSRDQRRNAVERNALAGRLAALEAENARLREAITSALYDYDHRDELSCIDTLRAALAAAGKGE